MSKVAVIATLAVTPHRREEAVRSLQRHRERCLQNEPGTLKFEVMIPREEADKLFLYEVYTSQEAFDTHWSGESLAIFSRETAGFVAIESGIWGTPAD